MVSSWELSYNGLTFGGNQQIGILSVEGLEPPEAKSRVRANTARDGSFTFAAYYAERHIVINGDMFSTSGPSGLDTLINSWRAAFDNQDSDQDLDYRLGTGIDRRVKCRPIRRELTVTDYDVGLALWVVELVAGDPAVYNTSNVKLYDG